MKEVMDRRERIGRVYRKGRKGEDNHYQYQ